MNDPLFGDIQDLKSEVKPKPSARSTKKDDIKGANFATGVSPIVKVGVQLHKEKEQQNKVKSTTNSVKACLYYKKRHTLNLCDMIKEQEHPKRIPFLKSKGICFGCLNEGHLSKKFKRRLTCADCALKHPTILHKTKENSGSDGNTNSSSPTVSNALLSLD